MMKNEEEQRSYAYDVKKELLRISVKNKEEMACEWVFYFICAGQPRFDGKLDKYPEYCTCRRKDIADRISNLMKETGIPVLQDKKSGRASWYIYPIVEENTVLTSAFRGCLHDESLDLP